MKRWKGDKTGKGIKGRSANGGANILTADSKLRNWLFGLFLVAITMLAYQPVWHAGFVWDDNQYVTGNVLLHSLDGLRQIWFVPGATVQYYPLTFTTFWIEYHLWGLHPLGYHLVNVFLHSLNAVLFWLILRRLGVPGAWLAAGIFALHPVCVESVAFVTERKNTLSGLFYLGTLLAALRFWLPEKSIAAGTMPMDNSAIQFGGWKFYWLALVLYLCALWSKTATIPLPLVILLLVWWKQGRPGWRSICLVLPFLAVGVVMGLITMQVEKHLGANGKAWDMSFLERYLIASRAVWFYLGKLVWPYPLIFIYTHWKIDASQISAYLPGLAMAGILIVLWLKRHSWGRPMLFALAYFLALLSLVVGFFNIDYFQYSYVSDHFQYLACLSPLTLLAAGAAIAFSHLQKWKLFLKTLSSVTLFLVLGFLTWRQCTMYADDETLWRTTIARNPDCALAHNNLGNLLLQKDATAEAMAQFQKALEIQPDNPAAYNNLGAALIQEGKFDDALGPIRKALAIDPNYAMTYNNLGNILLNSGQVDEALMNFKKALEIQPNLTDVYYNMGNAYLKEGEVDLAIQWWRKALEIQPDYAMAHNNLGNALLQEGRINEAILHFKKALESKPDFVDAHNNLANALLQSGKVAEAVEHWQHALEIRPDYVPAQNNLAWVLATCPTPSLRNGFEAVKLAQQANQLSGGNNPLTLRTLAAAYAENGQMVEAIASAQRAIQLARFSNEDLFNTLREEIKFYQAGIPFRDLDQTNVSANSNP